MREVVFECWLPPGDVVVLSATIRDLHLTYPGEFRTEVRCGFPEVFEHSPYIQRVCGDSSKIETIEIDGALGLLSDQSTLHYTEAVREYVNQQLGINAVGSRIGGDLHLSERELEMRPSLLKETLGDKPYWLIVSGGKRDFTTKWWPPARYQKVVEALRDSVTFVQVGASGDFHPRLTGVVDLRAKTTLRDLICLTYHAEGVLCPITCLMHLAAAVPAHTETGQRPAAVVIAGGREPVHWEAYSEHCFLDTIGRLECCRETGCWRARIRPLGDGHWSDHPEKLCVDVGQTHSRCMEEIEGGLVVTEICKELEGIRGKARAYNYEKVLVDGTSAVNFGAMS